jgi:hypothetical protein
MIVSASLDVIKSIIELINYLENRFCILPLLCWSDGSFSNYTSSHL